MLTCRLWYLAGFDMVTDTANAAVGDKIRCDACPVMCYIKPGAAGACDRYANDDGKLVRVDPHIILERTVSQGGKLVPFGRSEDWDGKIVHEPSTFVTAIGAGTTYPDYKPAPFIVSAEVDGVDMVTVVTEGIFSYCGIKVKIDTDRYLGPETATVRAQGEAVGHVTTSEYGSQMLSLGGVHHLTGGSKKEGRVTCDTLMDLANCKAVELTVDGGAMVVVQAGQPPIVNGAREERMRVGCGSATIGMFAKQWHGKIDEVVVVGAGGSLRAGVTDNPVRLTRSVKDALTRVTSGGAPVYVWPGGGITYMVDVTQMPSGAFGYVPTPALVAPIEFTMKLSDYAALGGHMDYVRPLSSLRDSAELRPMPYIPVRRA